MFCDVRCHHWVFWKTKKIPLFLPHLFFFSQFFVSNFLLFGVLFIRLKSFHWFHLASPGTEKKSNSFIFLFILIFLYGRKIAERVYTMYRLYTHSNLNNRWVHFFSCAFYFAIWIILYWSFLAAAAAEKKEVKRTEQTNEICHHKHMENEEKLLLKWTVKEVSSSYHTAQQQKKKTTEKNKRTPKKKNLTK